MLNSSKLVGFVATTKPEEAKVFYEQSLGLQLVEESAFALVFASGSNMVRIQKVQALATPPYTSLGWEVKDIAAAVQYLTSKGVKFERYEGLPQNDEGIWRTPDGSRVAWLQDPDGNTRSLTESAGK